MRNISHHFSPRRRTSKSRRDPPHFDPTQIYFLLTMMSRRIIGDKRALRLLRCRRESAIIRSSSLSSVSMKAAAAAAAAAAAGATSSSGEKATEFHEHIRTHTSRLLGGVAAFTTTFIGFTVVSADTEGITTSSEKKEADQNAFESLLKNAKEFVSQLTSRGSSYSLVSDEYRREVFFAYENRLREHSSMDKVFAYFASGKNANGETLMTKEDLIRSAIPVYQKTNIRSGSLEGEVVSEEEVEGKDVMETNVFKSKKNRTFIGGERIARYFDTNNDGMINFPEFVFFTTLIKLSDEQILREFLKADADGNGELDAEEFAMMMRRMRSCGQMKNAKADFHMSRTGVHIEHANLDVLGNGIYNHFFQK